MAKVNKSLSRAMAVKQDEFYTRLEDIELELRHYRDQFEGKVVFCNCDDPYESDFFKYFAMNFNHLGLKKLLATSYAGSPIVGAQLPLFEAAGTRDTDPKKEAVKVEIAEVVDLNDDGAIDLLDVEHLLRHDANAVTPLTGGGDFRSEESIALLDEADIVVTNPPFSLWRSYVAQLIRHDKQFLILGNLNGAKYKDIFPLFKANRLWFGVTRTGVGQMWFRIPDDAPERTGQRVGEDGKRYQTIGNSAWFTNLDHKRRHEVLTLYKRYAPEAYPTYTNYPAIEVTKTPEIPLDYDGEMGVPVTFLGKYSPDQFEIIGISTDLAEPMSKYAAKEDYAKDGKIVGGSGKLFLPIGNGKHRGVYERVIIKRIGAVA